MNSIDEFVAKEFPAGYTVSISGGAEIGNMLNALVVRSQIISLLLSFVLVFLVLAISYKSFWAGLIGIIPLSFSVVMNFGLMGLVGIPLNIATALIASIAIGIGDDYTIHFLSAYKHHRLQTSDSRLLQKCTAYFGTRYFV